jgi:hypothetical protein
VDAEEAPAEQEVPCVQRGTSVTINPSKWITAIAMTTSLALSSCTYGSRYEAEIACNKWAEEGGFYTESFSDYEYDFENFSRKDIQKQEKVLLRYCNEEAETEQFLGFEKKTVKEGAVIERDSSKNYGSEVTQRFKY